MEPISINDLKHHVIKIGLDAYPPVVIPIERTKLGVLGEEYCRRWPDLFERLEASSTEFSISKTYGAEADPRLRVTIPTFVLVDRGPVFVAPLLLAPPGGKIGDEDKFLEVFPLLLETFRGAVGGRDFLRIGLVRELVFDTGKTPCAGMLIEQHDFAGATLIGEQGLFTYRDKECNVRITIQPVQIATMTRLPVGGQVTQGHNHGLKVNIDVNNHQLRALGEADMNNVLERARSLWPEPLLQFLNALKRTEAG